MVIAIIGENCTGKSTLADKVQAAVGGEIVTGKDYLRLAKSESEATLLFRKKLAQAVEGDNVIYVITLSEHLALLPEGSVKVLVTASLDTIKARFAERMHGTLPPPVARMLEMKHGSFDGGTYDYRYDSEHDDAEALVAAIKSRV